MNNAKDHSEYYARLKYLYGQVRADTIWKRRGNMSMNFQEMDKKLSEYLGKSLYNRFKY